MLVLFNWGEPERAPQFGGSSSSSAMHYRLGPSRSLLGALLEGTTGRMQCVLFRLANQNTSTANRGAK